jgi:hypothetical protein
VADTGSLVVGLINSPYEMNIYATSFHVVMKVDGVVVNERTEDHGAPSLLALPRELEYSDLPEGAAVETVAEIDFGNGLPPSEVVAASRIVAGRKTLERMTISQYSCASCDAGLTCNWGRCMDPYVPPEALEDYSLDWASFSYCKQKNAGAPTTSLGTGYESFTPLNDADVIDVYAGPQGGHHVYLSLRMNNLRQDSMVELRAMVPDLGLEIGPQTFNAVFYDYPVGGYCEVLGWQFQIDGSVSVDQLVGKTMEITGTISDADGDSAQVTRTVVLSTDIQGF